MGERLYALEVSHVDGIASVRASGELDMSAGPTFASELLPIAEAAIRGVEIDLSGLTFLDSTGLRLLIHARDTIVASGKSFRVLNAPGPVRRVIDITGTADILGLDPP